MRKKGAKSRGDTRPNLGQPDSPDYDEIPRKGLQTGRKPPV